MQRLLARSLAAHSEEWTRKYKRRCGKTPTFSHFWYCERRIVAFHNNLLRNSFYYQRCGGLLNIQNQLSYVASVMNSLHGLFHLRTTHSNQLPIRQTVDKSSHLQFKSQLFEIWRDFLNFKTVSVVILVVRTKTASSLQRTLPHVTLQTISGDIVYRFIRIERKTAWCHTQLTQMFQISILMKCSALENNMKTVSSVSTCLPCTDSCTLCTEEKSDTTKDYFLSHYAHMEI